MVSRDPAALSRRYHVQLRTSSAPSLSLCRCTAVITYLLGLSGILALGSFLVWHHLINNENDFTTTEQPAVNYVDPADSRPCPQEQQRPTPVRWKCGLRNLGNTCYMNSAIQCLRHIPVLRGFLARPAIANRIDERRHTSVQAQWVWEYNELIEWMEFGEERGRCHRVDPRRVYDAMLEAAPNTFAQYRQEDATEVVHHFFGAVETTLADDPRATAAWHALVRRSEVVDRRRWDQSGRAMPPVVLAPEFAYDLHVVVPDQRGTVSLMSLLHAYFNQPRQDLGEAGFIQEIRRIRDVPDALAIALNRVDLRQNRIQTPVEVPLRLDLQRFMADGSHRGPVEYDLLAVICHLGHGTKSGHYVAKARLGPRSSQWFLFNDSSVSRISLENALDPRNVSQAIYQRRRS